MQLNVPNGPQAPQNPSMVQWSHCKYYSMDQRGQKPGDLYNPDSSPQVSPANERRLSKEVTRFFSGNNLCLTEQPPVRVWARVLFWESHKKERRGHLLSRSRRAKRHTLANAKST